ncbi:serine/threonine protein kinase [Streptomyces zinciresistens K42]|uniref:non-specific serine/threonine protein kinase n=1 Tax=Streptomyces zinciresistens K42 TaxID=700597 RepID=G2GFK2_9ACTN|nr:serine/threonine-protein kinase [Streptomyces zinciresistens]EGX57697.1 serine/threonine protein kinase [Streptomyces zinciresistens K42]
MSEDDRAPGRRVVDGRFALEARLGGGGMGTVWRARDLALHRLVAVKEVRPPDRDLAEYDPEGARMLRERVLREARALARIDHPNVVTIHHIVDGGEGTYPWLVMELVSGGSLADRLERTPMPPAEAARIGRGVLAALTAAHDAGIQHRDVKPANVLMRPDGRPVLTDFGIAAIRETTSLTATGSIIGTADFMAPERISGHEGGSASDLWSLAMMLYTAVEGRHPLRRGTTLATLAAVLHEDVPPPERADALGGVLMSVLVRDASARPSAAELDRLLAEVEAGPAGPPRSGPTSYALTPPAATGGHPAPAGTFGGPGHPAGTFGGSGQPAPATTFGSPGRSAAPTGPVSGGFGPPPVLPQPLTAPAGAVRRGGAGRTALMSMSAFGVAGVVGLVWWLLPPGSDTRGNGAGSTPGTSSSRGADTAKGGDVPAAEGSKEADPAADQGGTSGSLLTPAGIRTAIKAFKEATGRDWYSDLTVYPEYVSAEIMVKGSSKKYDSYTYRPGSGVEKGIISSTISSIDKPMRLDGFDWDKVPALLAMAEKKLNVDKPTSRYIIAKPPNTAFDEPESLAVYLGDDYGSGYLRADPKGRVTKIYPAED